MDDPLVGLYYVRSKEDEHIYVQTTSNIYEDGGFHFRKQHINKIFRSNIRVDVG